MLKKTILFIMIASSNVSTDYIYNCIYAFLNALCIIFKHVYTFFLIEGTFKTNIHLERPYHLLTKTWKYGESMLGTEVA